MTFFLFLFYVVPLIYNWYWNHRAFSKGGYMEDHKPGVFEFVITVVPFINFVGLIINLHDSVSINGETDLKKILNFFNRLVFIFFNIRDK